MHINKYTSSYTQGRKMSPMRRSVNLYDTHFKKELVDHDSVYQESKFLAGSSSASFSEIKPVMNRFESGT